MAKIQAQNRLAFAMELMKMSRAGRLLLQAASGLRIMFDFVDTFEGNPYLGTASERARTVQIVGGYRMVFTYEAVSLVTFAHELYHIVTNIAFRAGFGRDAAYNYLLPVGDPFDQQTSSEAMVEYPAVRAANIVGREVHVALGDLFPYYRIRMGGTAFNIASNGNEGNHRNGIHVMYLSCFLLC